MVWWTITTRLHWTAPQCTALYSDNLQIFPSLKNTYYTQLSRRERVTEWRQDDQKARYESKILWTDFCVITLRSIDFICIFGMECVVCEDCTCNIQLVKFLIYPIHYNVCIFFALLCIFLPIWWFGRPSEQVEVMEHSHSYGCLGFRFGAIWLCVLWSCFYRWTLLKVIKWTKIK